MKNFVFILALLFLVGCTQSLDVSNPGACEFEFETFCESLGECVTVWDTKCPEFEEFFVEPQACSKEYNPVCGQMQVPRESGEIDFVRVTFSNPCIANTYNALEVLPGTCDEMIIPEDKFLACEELGGIGLPDYNECEYISSHSCDLLGGKFLECESACRNHEDYPDVMCTMQCVQVCSFD
ncbi:MAG: hypothetical protein ACMXX6_01285 [Candidatus Woesearchaeota archaeon]